MSKGRTSTRDIALAAGVSQSTVSNVLNGRCRLPIADSTREKVQQAATKLRYRPNRLATGMFRGKTNMVGVVLPNVGGSFYGDMLRGIQNACMQRDCVTLLSYTQVDVPGEEREVSRLLEHRVDGLLVAVSRYTLSGTSVWLEDMRIDGIPCVILDDRSYSGKMDVVASDDVDGAVQAVEHLIGLGHRRIAFIAGPEEATTFRDRRIGYQKALVDNGIPIDPDLIIQCGWDVDFSPVEERLADLFAKPDRPTAIFAVTDYHAQFAMQWLRCRQIDVPGVVSVAGYAGTELSIGLGLTTVEQDSYTIGLSGANRLFRRMKALAEDPVEELLPTTLIARISTGPCPNPDSFRYVSTGGQFP